MSEDVNILERAKAEGLKVSADGRISLPGTKTAKVKAVKEVKTKEVKTKPVKEPAPPKEFKGINSKIFSSGDTLGRLTSGLSAIRSTVEREGIKCPYKVSTYKDEFRVAFDTIKGSDFLTKMTEEEATALNEAGFTVPDKKDFLAMKIA